MATVTSKWPYLFIYVLCKGTLALDAGIPKWVKVYPSSVQGLNKWGGYG